MTDVRFPTSLYKVSIVRSMVTGCAARLVTYAPGTKRYDNDCHLHVGQKSAIRTNSCCIWQASVVPRSCVMFMRPVINTCSVISCILR